MISTDVAAEIRAREEARRQALEAGDLAKLGALLSDDLMHVHTSGTVDDRTTYLASLANLQYRVVRPSPDVRVYGDVAVATGPVEMTVQVIATGATFSVRAFATHMWAKLGGDWKLVHVQSTTLT